MRHYTGSFARSADPSLNRQFSRRWEEPPDPAAGEGRPVGRGSGSLKHKYNLSNAEDNLRLKRLQVRWLARRGLVELPLAIAMAGMIFGTGRET